MTTRDLLWHAIVSAAGEILHADPCLAGLDGTYRQQLAIAIATAALDRLPAEMPSCQTAATPQTAREKLDTLIAAFDALHISRADIATITGIDRTDHVVVLGVRTSAEVAALAAELDLPQPMARINGDGYRWMESADHREHGTTVVIQGGHKARAA